MTRKKYPSDLYAERNTFALGNYYFKHVHAMTAEGLRDKAAIAAELAYRDQNIGRLVGAIDQMLPFMQEAAKTHEEASAVSEVVSGALLAIQQTKEILK